MSNEKTPKKAQKPPKTARAKPMKIPTIEILYEDEDIVAVISLRDLWCTLTAAPRDHS